MTAGLHIDVVLGDITAVPVDAIVNAANSTLLGGGGVDGAIHRVGGPTILAECKALRSDTLRDGLPAGQAVATSAGNLPARWVIHTVGPVFSQFEDRSHILRSAYLESMRVADELGAATVSFPLVSSGAYGWPLEDAAYQAITAIRASKRRLSVVLVTRSGDMMGILQRALS
ncbi:O-acetyl-ADP-ribose deacetylase [Hoyosella rhizosphaerae]|uniref:Macro domain-containing protein n=1 Tax=Hoyosella rhizosphaerae TaxID=1755582 RepID=A0A916UJ09_9ACTN|nr:O-acetyl-ADP-ribose deacetylase [Hoyosella rhizosphaerae]MBN4928141.1 O-acetyl-ADP-ribose deacetylase [Hoyosella rhizosphaerae]GGC72718.1 macro domain-containing protein [Hoyosella rhizosphaerae]